MGLYWMKKCVMLLICTKVPKWIGCLVIRVESCKEIFYLKGPPRPPLVVAFRVCPKMFVPIEIARTRNKKDYRAVWGGLSGDKLQAQTNVCDQVHIEKKIVGIQPNINTPNKKLLSLSCSWRPNPWGGTRRNKMIVITTKYYYIMIRMFKEGKK